MVKNTLIRATLVIIIMNLVSKVLGFVRETIIAREYGATYLTDAYNSAYTIPYFLQMVLGMALVTSIVPVMTKYLLRGEQDEAWKIASITMNWTVLMMSLLAALGIVSAGAVVRTITPGFSGETAQLTTTLTMIMFPSIVLMGAGMLMTGILNSRRYFAMAAFAPAFANIIIILAVFSLGYLGIQYLAWGTLLSMAGYLLIQIPALRKAGFRYVWSWDIRHPDVKNIFANLLPIFLGTAVNQVYLAINRYFASGLGEGSISALNYAGKLMNLPMGIFVLAVSSAIFPTLSEHAAAGNRQNLAKTLNRGLKMVLLVTLPAAAGLMVLSSPVVKLLFERGAFDPTATAMTAEALFYFSIGMFAMAVNMLLTRAYYALGDVRTPLLIGFLSILVNILASQKLTIIMGHSGLATANTIAAVFCTIFLYLLLRRQLKDMGFKELAITVLKGSAASILTAITAWVVFIWVSRMIPGDGGRYLFVQVMAAITSGAAVYAAVILFLREKEALLVVQRLSDKLSGYRRRKK